VDLVLTSGFPLVLLVGREHVLLYNDAFAGMLSRLHPGTLGRPVFEVLPEVRATSEHILARVWSGETLSFRDQHFRVPRNGPQEDVWVDISYSPLRDEAGVTAGTLVVVTETTARVLAQRRRDEVEAELREREARQRLLVELGDRTRELGDAAAIMHATVELLGRHLGVGRAGYGEIDDALLCLDIVAEWTESQPSFLGPISIATCPSDMLQHCRSGRVWVIEDVEADSRPAVRQMQAAYAACDARALISVPLTKGGRWLASLYVTSPNARAWTERDIELVRDVAERTWVAVESARAQAVLRESEERFRAISEQAEVGISIADLEGRIIYANDRHCEILGHCRDAVIGQTIQQMTHVEDWPRNKQLFDAMLGSGRPFTIEKRLSGSAGRVRWTRVTVSARRDARGRIIGGVGVTIDLTDRKLAEEALRASEERQAFLLALNDELRRATTPAEIVRLVGAALARHLRVAAAGYLQAADDGSSAAANGYSDGNIPDDAGFALIQARGRVSQRLGSGEDVVFGDSADGTTLDERDLAVLRRTGVVAGALVPLSKAGRSEAWLYALHDQPRTWPEAERVLLHEVTQRTREAIERARAEAAVTADLRDTRLLRDLAARLVAEGDVHVIYDEILHAALALSAGDAGVVQGLDDETRELVLLARQGFQAGALERFQRVAADFHAAWGTAIDTGQRTLVHYDPSDDASTSNSIWLRDLRGFGSVQATPLIARSGKPLGVLSTYWRSRREPSERELRFLDLLARQAADLIERKRSEELLCASEERLRRAISIDTVGVIFFDADGAISDANDAFLRMSGYDREDLAQGGVRWDVMTAPEFMQVSMRAVGELLARGETSPYEKQYVRKDGSRWWGLFAAKLLRPGQGVEFILDVTKRKEAEAALRASEARQAFLVEFSDRLREAEDPGQIMSTATELLGRQLGVAAVGYGEVEADGDAVVNGREYNDGTMPSVVGRRRISDYGAAFGAAMQAGQDIFSEDVTRDPRAPAGGSSEARAMRLRAGATVPLVKGGRLVAYLYAIHPEPRAWPEEDRRLIREVADRTWATLERARAEAALRQSEERFRSLVEPWAQAVWETDEAGIAIGAVPTWEEYTGQSIEESIGEGWAAVVHPDDRDDTVRRWREALRTGTPLTSEFRTRTTDGRWRWTNARCVPVRDAEGRVRKWFGMNIDITDRRQAEESLKEANRAKDEFLAILAHELRNPLAPLVNGLELLKPGHADHRTLEQARAMMARQVGQLVRLTDDLLDVSRISRGKVRLRRELVTLEDVVQQAVETSRPWIEASGNTLDVHLPAQPITLDGDATRLSQVFSNLLNNAAKYSAAGGHIELSAAREQQQVVIRVRDTGVGIPPDMLQHVFGMFTQVDRSLEKAQGGLGVGLSLAKGLVELHGGSIAAHSEGPGRGSEFVVRLPTHEAAASEALRQPPEVRATSSARRRVLIVDDNEDAATSVAMLLKVMNCDARVAHSGFEALSIAPEFRPELVLLDLGMPKLNGYDTCRRLRCEPWGRSCRIVALTGWSKNEHDCRAEDAGFDDHLVKPADRATLAELLGNLPRPEQVVQPRT
jgi:PAS domain S-box-containing protein